MPDVTGTTLYGSAYGPIETSSFVSSGTEVWVTEVGGDRLLQVPADAITDVSWTTPLDGAVTAELTVARYAHVPAVTGWDEMGTWLGRWLRPLAPESDPLELQIIHDGRIVCWGPVLSNTRTVGGTELAVSVVDFPWWFGRRLLPGVNPDWGMEWLTNYDFSDGLDAWTEVSPNPVVADEILQINGGEVFQEVHFPFSSDQTESGSWRVRWTIKAWIAAAVPDDFVFASMLAPGRVGGPQVSRQVRASEVNRDQWQTVVVDFDLSNTASQTGRKAVFSFFGDFPSYGPYDIQIDETSVQVDPTSLGVDPPDIRTRHMLSQQAALFEVVHGCSEDLNVSPSADGPGRQIETPWRLRGDVYASEALRQIADTDAEIEPVRSLGLRQLVLRTGLRGTGYAPEALTLTVGGNVTAVGSWESGTDRPTNEWRITSDDGYPGVYQDMSRYGEVLLQTLTAAPTGTGDSELSKQALARSQVTVDESDTWRLKVPASVGLRTGDRVTLVIDDGPDQWNDLVRVVSVQENPAWSWVEVDARRWDGG